jgi:hypothetical protein
MSAAVPITALTRMAADHYPVVANVVLHASGVASGRTPQPGPSGAETATEGATAEPADEAEQ